MAVAWPDGVPARLIKNGANYVPPETSIRSSTDSGLARQRAVFTAAPTKFTGNLRMSQSQMLAFDAWRKDLGGAVFGWPGHPFIDTPNARFVSGEQGAITPDQATPKWLVPVSIEILP